LMICVYVPLVYFIVLSVEERAFFISKLRRHI
jgi:hypothetical protein